MTTTRHSWKIRKSEPVVNGKSYIRIWHALFRAAIKAGYCETNPAVNLEKGRVDEGEIDTFTTSESRKMIRISPAGSDHRFL